MSLQSLLAQFLSALIGPWPIGIATFLFVFTSGMLIPGHSDYAGAWIMNLIAACGVLVIGANFLSVFGLLP